MCTRQFNGARDCVCMCVCVCRASPQVLCLADAVVRLWAQGRIKFGSVGKQKTYLKSETTHAVLSLLVSPLFFLRNKQVTLPFFYTVVLTCPSHVYNLI